MGDDELWVFPSPKFHEYVAIDPTGELDADPSKEALDPLTVCVNRAVGAWSGVMAMEFKLEVEDPMSIAAPTVFVSKFIGVTTRAKNTTSFTYALFPAGVMAMESREIPTGKGIPGICVAKSMGVTVEEPELHTYAMVPSGVMAMAEGRVPTEIDAPTVCVTRFIGTIAPAKNSLTYATVASGVMAMALRKGPGQIDATTVFVAASIITKFSAVVHTNGAAGRA